jgi:protein O-mannosyl-transferase
MIEPKAKAGSGWMYMLASVVVLLCLLAYGMALNGPLFFDDVPNLLDNPLVQIQGTALDDWRIAALSSDAGLYYRPVAMLTFALNHVVFGAFSAIQLKATNLAIHLLLGALLYFFVLALLQTPALRAHRPDAHPAQLVAVIAASLWLLHPIHVSTVLYAVQRMAQLSAVFTLAGLLVYTRYRLRWADRGAGPGELLAASIWLVLLGAFAVLSKENGALLPWLIAVVEVTLFRGVWCGQSQRRVVVLGWCAFLLPLLLAAFIAIFSPEVFSGRFGGREFTLEQRLLTQGRVLWQYLAWLLVPNVLDMGFFQDDIPISRGLLSPLSTLLAVLAWAGVIVACVLWHKRYPLFAFACLFYLVAHSMESTVFPLEMAFEHRNYLPSMGLAVLAAVALPRVVTWFNRLRLPAVVGVILAILAVLLVVRTHAWSDELTLARFEVINHPQSPRANFFYANALFKRLEQSTALGLREDEKRALAVTSRRYFERMHSLNERDFAALVMLYQLDTLYFPGLAQQNDWLGKMEELARTRRLQSSDRTALAALVGFSTLPAGAHEKARVRELVEHLIERNPRRMDLLAAKYRLLVDAQGADRESLHLSLERAAQLNPDSRQAAAYLAQFHGKDDLAGTYEAIREWLRRDPYRRELPVIQEIFDN